MSAQDSNTDDVEELPERLSDDSGGHMAADGPGEFWCPKCGARCTRDQSSHNNGVEYGHRLDCPDRDLPDPRDFIADGHHQSSRLCPNVGESHNHTSPTLERYKAAHAAEDDE
jgi:predicted RNA-binding Zn-ribbon protein involved in translation (DUF1610 family)